MLLQHLQYPHLPPGGFTSEHLSYEPLIHLLNSIICTTNNCLLQVHGHYLGSLQFYSYGPEVANSCGSVKPLKPDGVGLLAGLSPGGRVSWEHVEVIIEVKNDIKALIKQAATYARCPLLSNRRRFFSIAIGFNHKTLNACFLIFHSGLSSSYPLSLKTRQGFEDFVKHMVGPLSIRGEADYHLDLTLSKTRNQFYLNVER